MLLGTVMEVVEGTPGKDIRKSGTISFDILGKIIGRVSITFLYFCMNQSLQTQPTAPLAISSSSIASPSSSAALVSCSFRASAGSSLAHSCLVWNISCVVFCGPFVEAVLVSLPTDHPVCNQDFSHTRLLLFEHLRDLPRTRSCPVQNISCAVSCGPFVEAVSVSPSADHREYSQECERCLARPVVLFWTRQKYL